MQLHYKMHSLKILIFLKLVTGKLFPNDLNQWAYNPLCPTEDAKQDCDNACMDVNVVCTIACGGNYDCISNCTRAYYTCIENCPCNKNCFLGCPCPEENEFCIPEVELECEEEFEFEFNQCHDDMQQDMFDCVALCDNHDHDCEINCFIQFDDDLEKCPCMTQCENGCPCEFFDCPMNPNPDPGMPEYLPGVISTDKFHLNNSCFDNHWVENTINPVVDRSCDHRMITHYVYTSSYNSMTPQYCIDQCESKKIYEYAAVSNGNECWCGNQPPYNQTLYECRIPCSGDKHQYCGGRDGIASFYKINAQKGDGLTYTNQTSADGSHEISVVESKLNNFEYLQSWFTFECPPNYHIMYYFEQFNLYKYSSDHDRDSHLYMTYNDQVSSFTGKSPCKTCPDLYDWHTTNSTAVEFQYRVGYYESKGFKMALKCHKKSA